MYILYFMFILSYYYSFYCKSFYLRFVLYFIIYYFTVSVPEYLHVTNKELESWRGALLMQLSLRLSRLCFFFLLNLRCVVDDTVYLLFILYILYQWIESIYLSFFSQYSVASTLLYQKCMKLWRQYQGTHRTVASSTVTALIYCMSYDKNSTIGLQLDNRRRPKLCDMLKCYSTSQCVLKKDELTG